MPLQIVSNFGCPSSISLQNTLARLIDFNMTDTIQVLFSSITSARIL